jgi:hypothetical protein
MLIYVHKVRMNPMDGWGASTGIKVEILGRYKEKEKALEAKNKRDGDNNHTFCDVGNSWVEEEVVE